MPSERLATKARDLVAARERRDETAKIAEAAERAYREKEDAFWESLDDEEQTTAVFDLGDGVGRVQFQKRETITSRVISGMEDDLREWARENGYEDAIFGEPRIHKRVTNEYVRDWLQAGQPLPPGLDFVARRYVTITRKD